MAFDIYDIIYISGFAAAFVVSLILSRRFGHKLSIEVILLGLMTSVLSWIGVCVVLKVFFGKER